MPISAVCPTAWNMHRKPRHRSSQRSERQGFWYDLGRSFFPELAHHPRALKLKMILMTAGVTVLFLGLLVGFYRRASTPPEVLMIQAREANR